MDTARYYLGILLVVGLPPAALFWLIIHPFVRFWRRIGPLATYIIVGGAFISIAFIFFRFRDGLLGDDLGTNWILIAFGTLLYAASAWISVLTRRQLEFSTFAGLPELSRRDPGRLLQDGVYGVVRHPRYVSVVLGTSGFAMFVNHAGGYWMVLAMIPVLCLVAVLEERELAVRFEGAYDEYRARVPAAFPRITKRSGRRDA